MRQRLGPLPWAAAWRQGEPRGPRQGPLLIIRPWTGLLPLLLGPGIARVTAPRSGAWVTPGIRSRPRSDGAHASLLSGRSPLLLGGYPGREAPEAVVEERA